MGGKFPRLLSSCCHPLPSTRTFLLVLEALGSQDLGACFAGSMVSSPLPSLVGTLPGTGCSLPSQEPGCRVQDGSALVSSSVLLGRAGLVPPHTLPLLSKDLLWGSTMLHTPHGLQCPMDMPRAVSESFLLQNLSCWKLLRHLAMWPAD